MYKFWADLRDKCPLVFEGAFCQCINLCGEDIAMYGTADAESAFDTKLYRLPCGRSTQPGWDCKGLYVPVDREVRQRWRKPRSGPIAIKYVDFMRIVVTAQKGIYIVPSGYGTFTHSRVRWPNRYPITLCWPIPVIKYAEIRRFPEVPDHQPVIAR